MTRETYRERIDERLRMLQVYDVFLRYGADGAFDRGVLGDFRRFIQSRLSTSISSRSAIRRRPG